MVTALIRIEGQADRRDRQRSHASGRRDRRRRRRQGRRFMQLCDAFDLPLLSLVRHAGLHGRARGGEARRWSATPAGCSSPAPISTCPASPSCCARATASARWRWRRQLPRRGVHRLLAHRRVRRDGAGGRGPSRLSPRAGGPRRPGRRASACSRRSVAELYERGKAHQRGALPGDRRRDRPGGVPRPDRAGAAECRAGGDAGAEKAAVCRCLVSGAWRARRSPPEHGPAPGCRKRSFAQQRQTPAERLFPGVRDEGG